MLVCSGKKQHKNHTFTLVQQFEMLIENDFKSSSLIRNCGNDFHSCIVLEKMLFCCDVVDVFGSMK